MISRLKSEWDAQFEERVMREDAEEKFWLRLSLTVLIIAVGLVVGKGFTASVGAEEGSLFNGPTTRVECVDSTVQWMTDGDSLWTVMVYDTTLYYPKWLPKIQVWLTPGQLKKLMELVE
jgi:hypothetical protein